MPYTCGGADMLCKTSLKSCAKDDLIYVFFNGFGSDYHFWDEILPYFAKDNYVLTPIMD